MNEDGLIEKAADLAYEYQKTYRGCSQVLLKAIEETLGIQSGSAFNAATALAAGVARMGDTCGALVGGILAVGLVFGREKLEPAEFSRGYTEAHYYSAELCERFKKELGSTRCFEILTIRSKTLGKTVSEKEKQNPHLLVKRISIEYCPEVVRIAARCTAQVILEAKSEPKKLSEIKEIQAKKDAA